MRRLELTSELTLDYILQLHAHQDATFRNVIFIYGVAIGILAFAQFQDFHSIAIVASLMIVLVLCYATYVTVDITRLLWKSPNYSRINTFFYFAQIVLFVVLFVLIITRFDSKSLTA